MAEFEGVLKKTWKTWAVSALFRDVESSNVLDTIKKSTESFFASDSAESQVTVERVVTDASYKLPSPLLFRIQEGGKEVCEACLLPAGRTNEGGPFVSVAALLTRGREAQVAQFRKWFHFHFDCSSALLLPSPHQLTKLFGHWVRKGTISFLSLHVVCTCFLFSDGISTLVLRNLVMSCCSI
eukprot:c10531_g1_i1.p1 GENE.c10531_g1_i1~~c10531_g1_i1.p1  ORF type:complete len:191 (+),score=22.57 c10531_g1_i1:28-573(+)